MNSTQRLTTVLLVFSLFGLVFTTLGAAARPGVQFDLQTIKTEPTPVQTGTYADVWMKVRNTGDMAADNATIRFIPQYPFSVDDSEKTVWHLGTVRSGEEYRFHFRTRVADNAVVGNNSLVFRTQGGNNDVTVTHKVPVEVRTNDEALVIDTVQFPEAAPGTRHPMTLQLHNMGDATIRNVDVTLDVSATGFPFATVGTTRQRISSIGPGEQKNVTFTMYAAQDANIGVYKLPITLTYENQAGTSFTKEDTTGLVIGGRPQINVAVDDSTLKQTGQQGKITFRIVNRGEGRARFLQVQVGKSDAYDLLSPSSVYVGNMDPDDYQTAQFTVYVKPGTQHLQIPVHLSYRDASSMDQNRTQTVSVPLYTGAELQQFNAGKRSIWPYAVVVLIVIGAGVWYWRRRR